MQINQMRQDVAAGRIQQVGRGVGINKGGQFGRSCHFQPAQGVKDGRFPKQPVLCQFGQPSGRIGDSGAMTRQKAGPSPMRQCPQRGHIGRHVAIRRRHQRAGPLHDMIAGKQDFAQGKSDMAPHVSRQVQHVQRQPPNCHDITVRQPAVWQKAVIGALATRQPLHGQIGHDRTSPAVGRAECQNLCPGFRLQARHKGRVIKMRVGHKDPCDLFALSQRRQQCRKMVLQIRPRVDHGDLALAHQIRIRPGSGQR